VGCQLVPNKNSSGETELNKGNPWLKRNPKIRITIIMENKAQKKRAFSIIFSVIFFLPFCSVFASLLRQIDFVVTCIEKG